MSHQLNFLAHSEPENHHRNVKQFGASDVPRSTKKTALTDVKNILPQRSVLSTKKPPQSSAKKPSTSKKNLLNVFSDKENYSFKKEIENEIDLTRNLVAPTDSRRVLTNEAEFDVHIEPVCSFCNKDEDDYADIMMKNLKLSKSEIERFALEWGRQPVVGLEDMREFESPVKVPDVTDAYNLLHSDREPYEPDMSLLNDIPCVGSNLDFMFEE